jgi:hypothetical protein
MRTFQTLNKVTLDGDAGILYVSAEPETENSSLIALKQEGGYIVISASHGPIEIALRPRLQELTRVLARLKPVEGLQTTRQVGTGEAYISLGLGVDGTLLLRPTIVADATGHLTFNLALTDAARVKLFEWLPVTPES